LPSTLPPPPSSTPFPYTTLFRSRRLRGPQLPRLVARVVAPRRPAGRALAIRDCLPPRPSDAAEHSACIPRRGQSCRPTRRHRRRSEEHTSELQSLTNLVCRLLLA